MYEFCILKRLLGMYGETQSEEYQDCSPSFMPPGVCEIDLSDALFIRWVISFMKQQ